MSKIDVDAYQFITNQLSDLKKTLDQRFDKVEETLKTLVTQKECDSKHEILKIKSQSTAFRRVVQFAQVICGSGGLVAWLIFIFK